MTRAHIITRVVTAATAPLVRNAGPVVADAVKHTLQFVGFLILGSLIAIAAWIGYANGLPWTGIKTAALTAGLVCTALALLIVVEQIRLTYHRQNASVYDAVAPFEQRRPPERPDDE